LRQELEEAMSKYNGPVTRLPSKKTKGKLASKEMLEWMAKRG
jgi:hypothetical protein